ncbi:hypothetical protein GCM10008968_25260 [Bacillus horti]
MNYKLDIGQARKSKNKHIENVVYNVWRGGTSIDCVGKKELDKGFFKYGGYGQPHFG